MFGRSGNIAQIVRRSALPRSDQAACITLPEYTQTERLIDGVVHSLGVVMSVIAQQLSDADIDNLAAWYSGIQISVTVPE